MTVSIPVAGFLSAEFIYTDIYISKRTEKAIKVFRIRKFKHKFLKCLCVFKSIIDRLVQTFYMKIVFKILKILHKKVKQVITSHCKVNHYFHKMQLIGL